MASSVGNSCHHPVFCIPFTDTRRVANSANLIDANLNANIESKSEKFKVPSDLHSEMYREYSASFSERNSTSMRTNSASSSRRREEEFVIQNSLNANGEDYSTISQTEDSIFSAAMQNGLNTTTRNHAAFRNDITDLYDSTAQSSALYETQSNPYSTNASLTKFFTRFGKKRRSSNDIRDYFSDTERDCRGKNKGKQR